MEWASLDHCYILVEASLSPEIALKLSLNCFVPFCSQDCAIIITPMVSMYIFSQ